MENLKKELAKSRKCLRCLNKNDNKKCGEMYKIDFIRSINILEDKIERNS